MGKITGLLPVYEPALKVREFAKLKNGDSLDAIGHDVNLMLKWNLHFIDGVNATAFLIGVFMDRAAVVVKKAKRGKDGHADDDEGLEAWKKRTFPEVARTLLWEYSKFSREVFARMQAKDAEAAKLEGWSVETFDFPKSKQDFRKLMVVVSEVVEGKRYTAWLRAVGRMRQPLIGAGGHREGERPKRTKAQIELDELRERAAEEFPSLKKDITDWIDSNLHVYLEDEQIVELKDLLNDFKTKVTDLAMLRRAKPKQLTAGNGAHA